MKVLTSAYLLAILVSELTVSYPHTNTCTPAAEKSFIRSSWQSDYAAAVSTTYNNNNNNNNNNGKVTVYIAGNPRR